MKKILISILFLVSISFYSNHLFAQGPPAPPDDPGTGGGPVGGGAPIGSGLAILLSLGAAYGGKKVWDYRRKLEE
jgi:hypothetical protein